MQRCALKTVIEKNRNNFTALLYVGPLAIVANHYRAYTNNVHNLNIPFLYSAVIKRKKIYPVFCVSALAREVGEDFSLIWPAHCQSIARSCVAKYNIQLTSHLNITSTYSQYIFFTIFYTVIVLSFVYKTNKN